jgi:hypothetical protein
LSASVALVGVNNVLIVNSGRSIGDWPLSIPS